ncbi:hypothetical protein Tco_1462088, partial [Tanacetum coccineum]
GMLVGGAAAAAVAFRGQQLTSSHGHGGHNSQHDFGHGWHETFQWWPTW